MASQDTAELPTKPKSDESAAHWQLVNGVNGRAEPVSKPPVAYSFGEAARAAAVGTSKLRAEVREGRLIVRKLGKRSIVAVRDLENWFAALPSIHDLPPTPAPK